MQQLLLVSGLIINVQENKFYVATLKLKIHVLHHLLQIAIGIGHVKKIHVLAEVVYNVGVIVYGFGINAKLKKQTMMEHKSIAHKINLLVK